MAEDRRSRVRQIFDQAAELPPEQRPPFLDAACRDDPALRAEVEALLAYDAAAGDDEDGGSFLKSPLVRSGKDEGGRMKDETATSQSSFILHPSSFPHYRILGVLGEGGMGTVYAAEQENPHRPVALKVIRPGLLSPGFVKRFTHEAQILARLHHPGIAQVYEAGLSAEGQPYFAMELIRGVALDEYARRLDVPARLALLARVCDAVQHAHDKGVIHRDLKPGNILVDEAGQPKVLDFGVARVTDADLLTTTGRTEVGQLIGTLAYMSPEQMAADPRLIDHRTDVYALGVILFELLAGRLPYDLQNLPLPEAARVVRDQEPSRLGSVNTHFRGDIETIAGKALEKDRARRYASAADLAADIRRHLNNEPIRARPPSALYQLRKFARRNKALVGGVAGVFLALVLGMIGTTIFAFRESDQRREAERERQAALRQAYLSRIAAAAATLQVHDVADAARHLENAPEALRDWEWRHLASRLDESSVVLRPPAGSGFTLTAGPGEPWLWSVVGTDLRLTDLDGRELRRLPVRRFRRILWVGPRRGGLAIVDEDARRTLRLLDETGKVWLRADDDRKGGARFLAVLPEPPRLAVFWWGGPSPNGFELFGPASPKPYATCVHTDLINALAFSPDGTLVASASDDGTARLWNAATGATTAVLRGHARKVLHVAFSSAGDRVLTASADGTVRQWGPRTGAEVEAPLEQETGEVLTAVYRPDGKWIASAGSDRTIRLRPATGRHEVLVRQGHPDSVLGLAFSRNGHRLASAGADGSVRVWEADPQVRLPVLRGHGSYVYPVAYSPDGRWIASGSWDKTVRIWDAATGEPCATLDQTHFVRTLAFSPDGAWLVTGCDPDGSLSVWDVATARLRKKIAGPGPILTSVAVSPDGARVAALDRSGKLTIADVATGREVASKHLDGGFIKSVIAYSPDGRWLAGTGKDLKTVCLWDSRTLALSAELTGHGADVFSVAFSRDGRRLASASSDRTVRVWDVDTGKCQVVLRGHTDEVLAAAFHPAGTRIATAGRDRAVWLWDLATGEEVARLQGHTNYVFSLAFSPDGAALASASGDSTLRLWDTEPVARRHAARRAAQVERPRAERLVARLFAELRDADRVAARLRADESLGDALRRAALQEVMRRGTPAKP
jgi:WD40 repeat protein/predicted Ser/Thr protein kinase